MVMQQCNRIVIGGRGKFTDVPVKHKISRCALLCAASVTDNAVLGGWCVRPKFLLAEEEEFFFCSDAFLVWLAGDSCASRSNLVGIKTNESNQEGRQAADIKRYWLVSSCGWFSEASPSTLCISSRLCRCASLRWRFDLGNDQECQKCDQRAIVPVRSVSSCFRCSR